MSALRILRVAAAGMMLTLGGSGASAQQPEPVIAMRAIERGQWQLRESTGELRKICLGSPAALVQIRHPGVSCQHYVMANTERSATIRYACAGHGHGRTTVTVETGKLIRIETQGVADGSPFSEEYEGRLLGRCG